MECVSIKTYAQPGRPASVGHLGTVIVTPQENGEILVEFTLSRKGARRLGLNHPPVLDKRRRKEQTDEN